MQNVFLPLLLLTSFEIKLYFGSSFMYYLAAFVSTTLTTLYSIRFYSLFYFVVEYFKVLLFLRVKVFNVVTPAS